jgi:ferredoxin
MSKPDASTAEKKAGNPNTKKIIGFVVAVGLFILLWLVPIIPNMPMEQQHVLALLAFTITCWITRPWMPALTGMLFILLAWGLGLADEKAALYGFGDSTPWFIWGGLLMALAVRTTKLHLRIAYLLLSKTSASTQGVIAIQYVVHYVLSLMIPSTTARVTTTAPIAASQIEALGLPIKSRAGKMMMISLIMAPFLFTRGTLTGGSTQILAWGILNENGISLSWLQWYLYMLFPVIVAAVLLFIGLNLLFRPEKPGLVSQTGDGALSKAETKKAIRKIAQDQLTELGKFSRGELKVSIILVSAVILWCTESFHGISADLWEKIGRLELLACAEKARDAGKIANICFSFHDEYEVFERILNGYDGWDMTQLMYNYMDIDTQAGQRGVELAASKGVAVISMEPLRGGKLAKPIPAVQELLDAEGYTGSFAGLAFKWVWDSPLLSVALSGMTTLEQLDENLGFADKAAVGALSDFERDLIAKIREIYQSRSGVPCTACGYCLPCPQDVRIPFAFELYNEKVAYGYDLESRRVYNLFSPHPAENCVSCGVCDGKCPQTIPISEWMPKIHAELTE